mmetsp:Transcript_1081/g.1537  ORF Transcript_1081/g.1537 Transcript_1081/m.1537 type:complete len:230 (-) Transcript_1081:205-894(-)
MLETLPSTSSSFAFSNLHVWSLRSLTKYCDKKPWSNFIPSVTSSSFSNALPSWTVITPSKVTRLIAEAINDPIVLSLFAEIVATCVTSSLPTTGLARVLSSSTTASTAVVIPRWISIGFMPAATALHPSRKIARDKIVAVVVPSPAMSLVLDATLRTNCAPKFSVLSANSMLFATVTPSLVIFGAPNDCSMITLRPFGPNVTCTASASLSTPRIISVRASEPKWTSFAA